MHVYTLRKPSFSHPPPNPPLMIRRLQVVESLSTTSVMACTCYTCTQKLCTSIRYSMSLNVKSTDRLRVDEIGPNHLHVDAISEQFSGIYILQKTFIFLLSHLNRLNNTWVGSNFRFITINDIQSTESSTCTRRCNHMRLRV